MQVYKSLQGLSVGMDTICNTSKNGSDKFRIIATRVEVVYFINDVLIYSSAFWDPNSSSIDSTKNPIIQLTL